MRIEGSYAFTASPLDVYRVFIDPARLKEATPGCQSMEPAGEDCWKAVLKIGVAGISGTYEGVLEIKEKMEPQHYRLVVQGQGAPGYVNGEAGFDFTPAEDGGTLVKYLWEVQVGGLVASVGQRVLGSVGKMLIGQFMQAMAKAVV